MTTEPSIDVMIEPEIQKVINTTGSGFIPATSSTDTKLDAVKMEQVAKWCDDNNWRIGPLNMRYGLLKGIRIRLKLTWDGVEWQSRCKASKSELLRNPSKTLSWKNEKSIPVDKIKVTGRVVKMGRISLLPQ